MNITVWLLGDSKLVRRDSRRGTTWWVYYRDKLVKKFDCQIQAMTLHLDQGRYGREQC